MHTPSGPLLYVIAAYVFGASVLTLLACWIYQADRKARQQLTKWTSDES
jgi:hypothetical protein